MTKSRSTTVPKEQQETFATLTAMTDRCCEEYLNSEYADLARYAIAALCRKKPCPLSQGYPQTWACAVLCALGHVNFLYDKASKPYASMSQLCGHFGIAVSTVGGKAKRVRDIVGIRHFDSKWTLPRRIRDGSFSFLIEFSGPLRDAKEPAVAIEKVDVSKR
jgi:hypothetical protein